MIKDVTAVRIDAITVHADSGDELARRFAAGGPRYLVDGAACQFLLGRWPIGQHRAGGAYIGRHPRDLPGERQPTVTNFPKLADRR
jgi:hypothetical protein